MKLLHTSDWHLGRLLYGKKRDAEFNAFLDWLLDTLKREQIDVLVVAGDVFDTSMPSNQAQALYYQFLTRVAQTGCRHVVVIAGNHDSPSFINAPQQLLSSLNIYVVGQACDDLNDEVLILKDVNQQPELIICAVPYLRDRDIRSVSAGESSEDKAQKLIAGIQSHYDAVAELAQGWRNTVTTSIPIVATGHLFTAGGKVQKDDGVRDLYVGELSHFSAARFPAVFDYIALGHLHVPQKVAGQEHIRYCGSPIPMGFGEAKQQKEVCLAHFEGSQLMTVTSIPVPSFQDLTRVQGSWLQIEEELIKLKERDQSIWIEVVYQGDELMPNLREQIEALTQNSKLEVLRIQNQRIMQKTLEAGSATESLDELNPTDVFERCLDSHHIPTAQRPELQAAFLEILTQHAES